jgi:CBS domain-containing protein
MEPDMTNYMLIVILHDLKRLPALLAAWKRIGVPGVTLTNSVGGYQAENWLDRIGLGRLFDHEDVQQRMLISVIGDEELLERAVSEADEVVGGFDRPHSGILFAVPVSHALGIRKRGQPMAPQQRGDPQPDIWSDGARKIDRATPVSRIVEVLDLAPIAVQADTPIQNIVDEMMARPRVHMVNVVNREDRLVGLIDLQRLADAFFFSVFPEEFLSEIKEIKNVMDYARQMQHNTAEDLMREPVWVKMDDTLEQAFRLMHENKLSGLPVIDDHYHLVGYINLLEIMMVCMDEGESPEAEA